MQPKKQMMCVPFQAEENTSDRVTKKIAGKIQDWLKQNPEAVVISISHTMARDTTGHASYYASALMIVESLA